MRKKEPKAEKTFLKGAEEVLRRARRPLRTAEILKNGRAAGLFSTSGKTPENTLSAALYRDVMQNPNSVFLKIAVAGRMRARPNSVRWQLRSR